MAWNFGEGNPLSESTGGYSDAIEWTRKVVDAWPMSGMIRGSWTIFSRYSRVETADGREVVLSEHLEVFRSAAGREALRHGDDA